jgi:hypothetical protein
VAARDGRGAAADRDGVPTQQAHPAAAPRGRGRAHFNFPPCARGCRRYRRLTADAVVTVLVSVRVVARRRRRASALAHGARPVVALLGDELLELPPNALHLERVEQRRRLLLHHSRLRRDRRWSRRRDLVAFVLLGSSHAVHDRGRWIGEDRPGRETVVVTCPPLGSGSWVRIFHV